MGNIKDYIKWRGDLTFGQSRFNEVDNLILACLSYVNLDGIDRILPGKRTSLQEVSELFFSMHTESELKKDKSFPRLMPDMMREMVKSARFQNAEIGNYVNEIVTEKEQQFSALEIRLDDGTTYISYRGTDGTIIGWKEDFNLSNGIIPAQMRAAEYLDECAGGSERALRIGGHSKGGNLAVYAASKCRTEIKENIIAVYDNDGPGFTRELTADQGFQKMKSRVCRIIPECSIIGMLLCQEKEPVIVNSSQRGILQHDGLSWEVMGPSFVRCAALNKRAVIFNDTLQKWIENMDTKQRDKFIDDLFSVFEITGAQTFSQLQNGGIKNVKAMLRRIDELEPNSKKIVQELIYQLFSHWSEFIFVKEGEGR